MTAVDAIHPNAQFRRAPFFDRTPFFEAIRKAKLPHRVVFKNHPHSGEAGDVVLVMREYQDENGVTQQDQIGTISEDRFGTPPLFVDAIKAMLDEAEPIENVELSEETPKPKPKRERKTKKTTGEDTTNE